MGRAAAEWKASGDPRCSEKNYIPKKFLREELDRRGIRVTQFAQQLGLSRSELSGMLSGIKYMGNEHVIRAAALLGVGVADVLEWGELGLDFKGASEMYAVLDSRRVDKIDREAYGNRKYYVEGRPVLISTYGGYDPPEWQACAMPGDFRDPAQLVEDMHTFLFETFKGRTERLFDKYADAISELAKDYSGDCWGKAKPRGGKAKPGGEDANDVSAGR